MKQLYTIIFLLGAFFTMSSCSDWLDVSPETEKKQEDMFSNETGYKNVLTGAYIRMKSNSLYGEEMVYGTLSMLAQNWNNTTTGSKAAYLRIYDYKAAEVESAVASIYNNLYKVIADVNGLLKDIDANRDVFKGNGYELTKAEALSIRAFCHFDILRLFGPMPTNLPNEPILPYVKVVSNTPNSKITYEQFTKNLLDDLQ
ncbi:MAG: RagB/SusD family nutrient uptake outer membrane protein, partial [Parabacteroides sp.]|nr:RagB/SusD family nutrient uptake outer membrane protein [Parabacteroides sp.]